MKCCSHWRNIEGDSIIGIKDFEIPKCCDDCLMKVCDEDGIDPYCTLTLEEFYHINSINTKECRGKECPLVELGEIEGE